MTTTAEAWFEGMAMEADHSEYEHAGIWNCSGCGALFWIVDKTDVMIEGMSCPEHGQKINPRDFGIPSYLAGTESSAEATNE
jgi:hypothetical protein